jgi:glyoxylase-like metal-dependent hydrolase (beta-lactamase superfamily II)
MKHTKKEICEIKEVIMNYKTIQLAPDLWAIEEDIVRCFLLCGENGALLIDSCMSGGDEFRAAVTAITNATDIQMTATHADGDHIGGFIKSDTVLIHPSEYEHLGEPKFSIRPLWDGNIIKAGNRTLTVRLIPGHTPGSTAFVDYDNKMIFIGDTVSDSHVFMFGKGRNLAAYIASLELLKNEFSEFGFYACHGSAVLPLEEQQLNNQLNCAVKLRDGELEGNEPPYNLPCKLYGFDGANILF